MDGHGCVRGITHNLLDQRLIPRECAVQRLYASIVAGLSPSHTAASRWRARRKRTLPSLMILPPGISDAGSLSMCSATCAPAIGTSKASGPQSRPPVKLDAPL